ncbi:MULTISPECIES: hypothetical protein [unclassified Leucobacter]|uniref:hypothetical protein n=1 Tax=unclassified Leucobacter TaxID=2621730 RepID=UPI000AE6DAB2|nr:hypothetical protein [Leucobacter sp. L43]
MSASQLPQRPPSRGEFTPRRIRSDAIGVLVMCSLAAIAVVALAIAEFRRRFVPGGIAWTLPIQPREITAEGVTEYGADGPIAADPISGIATRIDVIVPDVNPVSTVCLAISIVLAAIAALVVIACTARLTRSVLRGEFFTPAVSRAFSAAMWSGVGGALAAYAFRHFAANGVAAALDVRATDTGTLAWWGWYVIILFGISALGLIDIAIRRAMRLERETEGLV